MVRRSLQIGDNGNLCIPSSIPSMLSSHVVGERLSYSPYMMKDSPFNPCVSSRVHSAPARKRSSYIAAKVSNAFTLAEIVVVIVIMGILTAVVVPTVVQTQSDIQLSRLVASTNGVRQAMEMAISRNDATMNSIGASIVSDGTDNTKGVKLVIGYEGPGYCERRVSPDPRPSGSNKCLQPFATTTLRNGQTLTLEQAASVDKNGSPDYKNATGTVYPQGKSDKNGWLFGTDAAYYRITMTDGDWKAYVTSDSGKVQTEKIAK